MDPNIGIDMSHYCDIDNEFRHKHINRFGTSSYDVPDKFDSEANEIEWYASNLAFWFEERPTLDNNASPEKTTRSFYVLANCGIILDNMCDFSPQKQLAIHKRTDEICDELKN